MKRVILASQSPRRRELMADSGIPFLAQASHTEEFLDLSLTIIEAIERIAYEKAAALKSAYPEDIIIGADTVVYYQDQVLGKPKDHEDAFRMLKLLSGQTHEVITGVAIIKGDRKELFHAVTEVTFYPLTEEEIREYIHTEEPLDKAGAYAIQGFGKFLIAKISGDYYNVVGLPIAQLCRRLKDWR